MFQFKIHGRNACFFPEQSILSIDGTRYFLGVEQQNREKGNYYLKFTQSCNLRCEYCFQKKDEKIRKKIDIEQYKDILYNLLSEPNIQLTIFGGEPLLKNEYSNIEFLLSNSTNQFNIFSNGCFSELYYNLICNYSKRLNFIISIDGPERIHNKRRMFPGNNGFGKIKENINFLISKKVDLLIQINVDCDNIQFIKELFGVIDSEWGINKVAISINPVLHTDKGVDPKSLMALFLELDDTYKLENCVLNLRVLHKLVYTLSGKEFNARRCNVDNIKVYDFVNNTVYCCPENNLTVIGKFTKEKAYIDFDKISYYTQRNNKFTEKCRDCEFKFYCGYGCAIEMYDANECKNKTRDEIGFILDNANRFFRFRNDEI